MPASDPVDEPIVALAVLLLVQAPPLAGSLSVLVAATQTCVVPVMLPGRALTVTVAVV
jgi:hypothetical protein